MYKPTLKESTQNDISSSSCQYYIAYISSNHKRVFFFFYTLRNILLIHRHARKLQPLSKTFIYLKVLGRESWTVKKAECQKTYAFALWCWRRLLRVPWPARRSNESILKEISPGCSLEGLMLKLKLQYFGHLMRKVDSLEKTLMLGGIGGRKRRGWMTEDEMVGWHHRLSGHEFG